MEWRVVLPLLITVICYIGLGGFLFYVIEAANEQELRARSINKNTIFLRDHPCVSEPAYWLLLKRVVKEHEQGVLAVSNLTLAPNWDVGSAIFFAGTIVTTIGYGHASPLRNEGRIFCVFYAMFGIPITMLMLIGLGTRLARLRSSTRASAFLQAFVTLIIGVALLLLVPVVMFMKIEGWSYTDSLYFGFITLSSLGFGDLVPGQRVDPSYQGWYRLVTMVWIFLGLAWLSTVFIMLADAIKGGHTSQKKPAESQQPVIVVKSEAPLHDVESLELTEVGPVHDGLLTDSPVQIMNGVEAEIALRTAVQEVLVAQAYQEMAAKVNEIRPHDAVAAAVTSAVLMQESGITSMEDVSNVLLPDTVIASEAESGVIKAQNTGKAVN